MRLSLAGLRRCNILVVVVGSGSGKWHQDGSFLLTRRAWLMTTYFDRLLASLSSALEINAATLSGAADIIVIQQPDGRLVSTPFHVRFGKLQLLKSREKVVEIEVSPLDEVEAVAVAKQLERSSTASTGPPPPQSLETSRGTYRAPLTMLLGSAGEAFFVEETSSESTVELEGQTPGEAIWVERAPSEPPSPCSETFRDWRSAAEPSAASSYREESQSAFSDSEQPTGAERLQLPPSDSADLRASSQPESRWSSRFGSMLRRQRQTGAETRSSSSTPTDVITLGIESLTSSPPAAAQQQAELLASRASSRSSLEGERSPAAGVESLVFEMDDSGQAMTESSVPEVAAATAPAPAAFTSATDVHAVGKPPVALSLCGHLITPQMTPVQVHEVFEANRISLDYFRGHVTILNHPDILVRIHDQIYPLRVATPLLYGMLAFNTVLDPHAVDRQTTAPKARPPRARFTWFGLRSSQLEDSSTDLLQLGEPLTEAETELKPPMETSTTSTAEAKQHLLPLHRPRYMRKSLYPSSAQLAQLGLRPGTNLITFTVQSRLQGVQRVCSRIYLWPHDVRLCISDVDGTITRSDVLGQILPRVGKDWSHQGVASLYRAIARNGYKFLYLTSRAIGQASATRSYLTTLQQEGGLGLPDGPLLLSPDRVIESFTREVLRRRPQDFKIAALEQVRRLFPPGNYNPFFAGFGNRDSDRIAYAAVGVPPERVFIVNARGELQVGNHVYSALSSFNALQKLVDSIFPDISTVSGQQKVMEVHEAHAFNDYQYWKRPYSPTGSSSDAVSRFFS
jgi:hypothetical protein